MICGELNLVLYPSVDYDNYINVHNPRARDVLADFMKRHGFCDI